MRSLVLSIVCMAKLMSFLSHVLNSMLSIEQVLINVCRTEEKTSLITYLKQNPLNAFQMGRLQLSDFSIWKGALLNKGRQTSATVLTNPWTASVALAQSLDLTFFPKATFQLLFGKRLLKNMTQLGFPYKECSIIEWEWKEMISVAKCPPLKCLINIKLSTDNPKTYVCYLRNGFKS